jgi:hypothetical protein
MTLAQAEVDMLQVMPISGEDAGQGCAEPDLAVSVSLQVQQQFFHAS